MSDGFVLAAPAALQRAGVSATTVSVAGSCLLVLDSADCGCGGFVGGRGGGNGHERGGEKHDRERDGGEACRGKTAGARPFREDKKDSNGSGDGSGNGDAPA